MDLVRTPLDQTLALLNRSERRWSERMFNDRVLDRLSRSSTGRRSARSIDLRQGVGRGC
jgi:hypothetical protein